MKWAGIARMVFWPFKDQTDLGTALFGFLRIMWSIGLPVAIAILVLL